MTINRRKLFRDAWAYAKAFAAFDGRSPRSLIALALRKMWVEAKAMAARASRPVRPADRARPFICGGMFGGGMVRAHRRAAIYNGW